MNIRVNILSVVAGLSLLIPRSGFAVDRPVKKQFWTPATELLSQSRVAYLFEKYVKAKMVSGSSVSAGLASEKYQDLAKQAQIDAGTPEEFHGPCYKLGEFGILNETVSALACPDSIVVNEKRLDAASYGYQRVGIYHEAIHKKNNDVSFNTITDLGTAILTGIFCHYGLKKINPRGKSKLVHALGILIPSIAASHFVNSNYQKMYERRADIDGLYAANCAQCAYETAADRKKKFEVENNSLRFNGYLWPNEITTIADDLNAQGKLCAYHQVPNNIALPDKV